MAAETSPKKMNEYMYSSASEEVEAQRLAGLNELHNPHTLQYLKLYLSKNKKMRILELGCGSGHLAVEVIKLTDGTANFTGVDRDQAQVNNSTEALKEYNKNTEVVKLDIITEFDQLKAKGPFDLIYCRWLLVHLPNQARIDVLRNVLKLLSEDGVFVCDECDNRNVKFTPNGTAEVTAPYEEATQLWLAVSKALMKLLGNDLELTPEKISDYLTIAGEDRGIVKVEGQYQVILKEWKQKRLISDGYRSSASTLFKAYKEKPIEEIIKVFDECAKDNGINAEFLTQNVISFQKR